VGSSQNSAQHSHYSGGVCADWTQSFEFRHFVGCIPDCEMIVAYMGFDMLEGVSDGWSSIAHG